ncbi:alpha/beta hydrolase family protein [Sulfobacillus thermosulfidooxidans]|uniref:alpha/beta hydrolase family protein n=1 Tax=Sulfobacillus thermosulfidooxidans TaxID=28034 RepID=UPI0002DB6EF6|nr:alpha/beta fold hydrolase [Sulfobacillus thermosulfidooxidans]
MGEQLWGETDSKSCRENHVYFGSEPWVLPATLSLPEGPGPFPVVVLVHGSGPQDRNETIGPNQVFKDLAWGLCSRNIAVLRYDKRTRVYPQAVQQLASFTVADETTDDVLEAVAFLKRVEQIDQTKIFLLGHSLGGFLLPRIAQQTGDLAGVILLAANARPLEDVLDSQVKYLLTLPETTDVMRQALREMQAQIERLRTLTLDQNSDSLGLPFNVPASYWHDLKTYQPVQLVSTLSIPVLILQGESDYQVTMAEDFHLWQDATKDQEQVTCKSYPGLHHLFMVSNTTPATPASYLVPGHVYPEVIDDIAKWITTGHLL